MVTENTRYNSLTDIGSPNKNIDYEHYQKSIPQEQITFMNSSHNYCVCIIDIVESTKNTNEITTSHKIRQYYSLFLNTMSTVIKNIMEG